MEDFLEWLLFTWGLLLELSIEVSRSFTALNVDYKDFSLDFLDSSDLALLEALTETFFEPNDLPLDSTDSFFDYFVTLIDSTDAYLEPIDFFFKIDSWDYFLDPKFLIFFLS